MKQDLPFMVRREFLDCRAVGVAQRCRPSAPRPCIAVGGQAIGVQCLEAGMELEQVAASGAECGKVAPQRVSALAFPQRHHIIK